MGLNVSSKIFLKDIIHQYSDPSKGDTTYIFLDDNFYYFNPDSLKNLRVPNLNYFIPGLKKIYQEQFNKKKSLNIKLSEEKWNKNSIYELKFQNLSILKSKIVSIQKGKMARKESITNLNTT